MHDVSNAINILDPTLNPNASTQNDKWGCTNDASAAATGVGKCVAHSSGSNGNNRSLKVAFGTSASQDTGAVEAATAQYVSGRMTSSVLTRAEKGVVSSAFAKAHEGAEIVVIT